MPYYVIDRFEEDYAILEDDEMNTTAIYRMILPESAQEGDHLLFDGEKYEIDAEKTEKTKENVKSLFDRMRKKD